ncbi:MAG: S-layer homology domain-containing protein [Oscillospiraceae bacterium]|nr:S-layer homology domain-containing protein [Oscillospiraceae bacterium]
MKKRSRKKIWLAAAALALVVAVLPLVGLDGAADEPRHQYCIGDECGVCELADMIYSLPADTSEITLENAAQVLDQLHAIDRMKYDAFLPYEYDDDVFDTVYMAFAELCGGVGYGGMPTRFSAALDKINDLGMNDGGWVLIDKSILAEGKNIDFAYSDAQFRIERVGGGIAPMTVTLSGDAATMGMSWLSASPCAASVLAENGVQTGWTYKYPLPAGTYLITEVVSHTETTTGETVPTTASVLADGEYVADNSVEVEITAGGEASVGFLNGWNTSLTIKLQGDVPEDVSCKFTFDGAEQTLLLSDFTLNGDNYEYEYPVTASAFYSVLIENRNSYSDTYTIEGDDVTDEEFSDASARTVTFTFTRKTADMTITLTDGGDDSTLPDIFDVTVQLDSGIDGTYGDAEFTSGVATLSMGKNVDGAGTEVLTSTISGLSVGDTYTLSYDEVSFYDVSRSGSDPDPRTITAGGVTETLTFTRKTADMTITLTDGGDDSTLPEEVDVTVTVTGLSGTFDLDDGGDVTFDGSGAAVLTMGKDKATVTIQDIPAGHTYEVDLTPPTGYQLNNSEGYEGTTTEDDALVTFTLVALPATEDLFVSVYADPFPEGVSIIVELTDETGNPLSGDFGGVEFTDGKTTLTMDSSSPIKVISGLPIGTQYTVTASSIQGYIIPSSIISGSIQSGVPNEASFSYAKAYAAASFAARVRDGSTISDATDTGVMLSVFDQSNPEFPIYNVKLFDQLNWNVLYDYLNWGVPYTLKIDFVPPGYIGPMNNIAFTINVDGSITMDGSDDFFSYEDGTIVIILEKQSVSVDLLAKDEDGAAVPGVKFKIDGTETGTTGTDGKVTVGDLAWGTAYTLSVDTVPTGYVDPTGKTISFTVGANSAVTLGGGVLDAAIDEGNNLVVTLAASGAGSENPEPPVYNGGGGGGGSVPSAPLKDTDGDGIPDILDDDDDNDGLLDFEDPDPLTPNVVDLGSDICDRFDDLEHGAWYEEYIQYVVENGLMEGISDALFDPNGTTSRAQIVMTLWRMEGEPLVTHPLYFADVSEGAWYADALRWTNSEDIVLGYDDGRFGTNDPVTREQIATILWRYARFKGIDTSSGESTSLLKFSDAKKISAYAISALQWACGEELIRGTVIDDGSIVLDPQGSATRAQVAAILMRFCENIL